MTMHRLERPFQLLLVCSLLLGGCVAETSPDAPMVEDLDLVFELTVGREGGLDVVLRGALPAGSGLAERAISERGAVEVLYVDLDRGARVASGRLEVSHERVTEHFGEHGIEGELEMVDEVSRTLVVPAPGRGHGRLTLRRGDEVVAFEIRPDGAARELVLVPTEPEPSDRALPTRSELAGESDVGRASGALLSAGTCGDGVLDGDEVPFDVDGIFTIRIHGEACDDGNRESNDGCSSDCEFEPAFVGGNPVAPETYSVVFVPAGPWDVEEFMEYTRVASEDALRTGWFEDRADRFSFWALSPDMVPDLEDVVCGDKYTSLLSDVLIDQLILADFRGRRHTPAQMVIVHAEECRGQAHYGWHIRLGNSEWTQQALAHELGHALGHLGDEYTFAGGDSHKDCNSGPNIGRDDDPHWQCAADSSGATCPDGAPVGMYPIEGTCGPEVVIQCPDCEMSSHSGHAFCPVCHAQLTARLADHFEEPLEEICGNLADDDLDGEGDEGCMCEEAPPRAVPWQPCETASCVDDLGREICAGQTGTIETSPGVLTACDCREDGSFACESY